MSAAVQVLQIPGLAHPFAWFADLDILALRPCAAEELPEVLEKVVEHIRGKLQVQQDQQVQHLLHTWRPIGDDRCTTCGSYLVTLPSGETHCARCEQREQEEVVHYSPVEHRGPSYPCCGRTAKVGERVTLDRADVTCPAMPAVRP